MIDFFHKGASMTKRVTGIARLKGVPDINPRPPRRITRVGTFYGGGEPVASVLLEVADTPESRARGLMGRADIPTVCGMLFEGLSGGGHFWMKDCLVPIDVAFLDDGGKVLKTYSMKVDGDGGERYEYGEDASSAVEVAGGMLKKWGVEDGFIFKSRELNG